MTILPFPVPALTFIERFRQSWLAGDYVGSMTSASFEVRAVQLDCVDVAEAMMRDAQEQGASAEELREMDVAIRAMERLAAASDFGLVSSRTI